MNTILNIALTFFLVLILLNPAGAAPEDATGSTAGNSEPGVVVKVGKAIEHGARATVSWIEHGAKAVVDGVERGTAATVNGIKHGVKTVAHGVERGAKATENAASRVANDTDKPPAKGD